MYAGSCRQYKKPARRAPPGRMFETVSLKDLKPMTLAPDTDRG